MDEHYPHGREAGVPARSVEDTCQRVSYGGRYERKSIRRVRSFALLVGKDGREKDGYSQEYDPGRWIEENRKGNSLSKYNHR